MLTLDQPQLANLESALAAQQTLLAEAFGSALGHSITLPAGEDPVASARQAMQTVWFARVDAEQEARLAVTLPIVLIGLGVLVWRRSRVMLWALGGTLVYLLMFNLLFTLVLHKNYSFSTVHGVEDMILQYTLLVLLVFSLALPVSAWAAGALCPISSQTIRAILGLALMLQGVLVLPAAAYFVGYGALITWVLPDITLFFWAIHSLLQVALVGVFGLLYLGIFFLITKLQTKKRSSQSI
jgi:hypothetical protein